MEHRTASKCSKPQELHKSSQRTIHKLVSERVIKIQKSSLVVSNYSQFRSADILKQTQSRLHLCQATAHLDFNSSLGILHVFQSRIDIQCHHQPRCKPQRIIRFTGRLDDICSSSVELLRAKQLAKIRHGRRRKEKSIITVLNGEVVHELRVCLDTARSY